MRRIALPEDVAEALERFRRARGRGWRKALLHLAVEEERKALARSVWELRATAASHGLTEEEVRVLIAGAAVATAIVVALRAVDVVTEMFPRHAPRSR